MSAERQVTAGRPRLTVLDVDGGYLDVFAWGPATETDLHLVTLSTSPPSGAGEIVGLTLDDGLALLSFLAEALGVERYVPSDALAMVTPPEAPGGAG